MTYVRNLVFLTVIGALAVAAHVDSAVSVDSHTARATPAGAIEAPPRAGLRLGAAGTKFVVRLAGATVYAENDEQVSVVEWALERFAESRLALPDLVVHYFEDSSRCTSDEGKLRAGLIDLAGGDFVIYNCGTAFTLLHELGHAWDVHSMDDAARERFLAVRSLASWSEDVWARSGGEHLADVLAWGLQDGNVRPSRTLPNDDDSLLEAFVVATGREPAR